MDWRFGQKEFVPGFELVGLDFLPYAICRSNRRNGVVVRGLRERAPVVEDIQELQIRQRSQRATIEVNSGPPSSHEHRGVPTGLRMRAPREYQQQGGAEQLCRVQGDLFEDWSAVSGGPRCAERLAAQRRAQASPLKPRVRRQGTNETLPGPAYP